MKELLYGESWRGFLTLTLFDLVEKCLCLSLSVCDIFFQKEEGEKRYPIFLKKFYSIFRSLHKIAGLVDFSKNPLP